MKTYAVALAILLAFTSRSAVAQTTTRWTGELPLTEVGLGVAPGYQHSVASNDEIHVVSFRRAADIVAVRIAREGALVDPMPFTVSEGGRESGKVLWTGSRFLFLWRTEERETRGRYLERDGSLSPSFHVRQGTPHDDGFLAVTNGTTLLITDRFRSGSLIQLDGSRPTVALDTYPRRISTIATDGTDYLVSDGSYLMRVDGNSGATVITDEFPARPESQLTATTDGYLLFSSDRRSITATPVSRSGRLGAGSILVTSDSHWRFSLAPLRDGTVLVVWSSRSEFNQNDSIMVARISGAGVMAGPNAVAPAAYEQPSVSGGTSPLLVWTDSASVIRHGRIDPVSAALRSNSVTSFGGVPELNPAVAATNVGWFAVWDDTSEPDVANSRRRVIHGVVISPALGRSREFLVSDDVGRLTSPSIAAGDRAVLVTWWRSDPATRDVLFGRRFDPAGRALDAAPFIIADDVSFRGPAAVAWNGRYFLVAYPAATGQPLRVNRITPEGIVLDGNGKAVARSLRNTAEQTQLAIASSDGVSLLVWRDGQEPGCYMSCPPPPPAPRIEGIRLSIEADPLDSAQVIYGSSPALGPAVAAREGQFLVAWRTLTTVVGQLVSSRSGAVGAPVSIPAPSLSVYSRVVVAARPDGFFVTWDERSLLKGAFLDSTGRPVGQLLIAADEPQVHSEARMSFQLASRGNDLMVIYSRFSRAAGASMRVFARVFSTPVARVRGGRR